MNGFAASFDFSGKRALVVGGSSGIGNAIAQAFRLAGADVHIWGTRPDVESYRPEDGSKLAGLSYRKVDLRESGAIEAVDPGFDALDILVLSQGTVLYGQKEFAMEGFREVVEINLNSVMACAMRFHRMLRASKGVMIPVGSIAGFRATLGTPAYAASKTGLIGLTRTLGVAWSRDGIRVNAIAPGLVDTKLTKVTTANPERLSATVAAIPMKRLGTPEDMAGVALFLASPLAAYLQGITIPVDGGITSC